MKIRIISAALLILATFQSLAFEYHGIKSGMTRNEVAQSMAPLGGNKSKHSDTWSDIKNIPFPPQDIELIYDHNDRLYRAVLRYWVANIPDAQASALRVVLPEKYGAVIAGNSQEVVAVFTDDLLLEKSIEHYKIEYMTHL